ncbi:pyrimidine dimer DNA glycosylase/endonuclease V [Dermabacteraceae bacterium P13095]
MRLWTIHPRFLDRQALVAGWREALLAQKVLAGETKGYTNHPQLKRFREAPDPGAAIAAFLFGLADEADARGYRFNRQLIRNACAGCPQISVADGQLAYEWQHLLAKLARRSPERYAEIRHEKPAPHPLFAVVPGPIADWEREN